MADSEMRKLKRKRTTERTKATRFIAAINEFTENTPLDDYEHYRGRLQETLDQLVRLDDAIQDLLEDREYTVDVEACEEYIDSVKRALLKANQEIGRRLASSAANLNISELPSAQMTVRPSVAHSVKLPPIKLEPFAGDVETWARFWEQFESSIDKDPNLSVVNKHVFLRGYLEGEPKMLVDGIAVTASAYEDTKKILHDRYGDKSRIIQAHLDYLEEVTPIRFASAEALNTTYIECNRRIQALQALGEDVKAYGRVLVPKILRAFPEDICRRWIIQVKRESLFEGDVVKLMTFLGEEVDGALTAQKIRGEPSLASSLTPTAATLHVRTKSGSTSRRSRRSVEPFCVFCESPNHWAQDCKTVTDVKERIEKLKSANRCFLCLNRGHYTQACSKRGRVFCSRCKKGHHLSVCMYKETITSRASPTTSASVGRVDISSPDFTHLQTARVWVMGPTGLSRLTRCVLDGGSQCSFIARSVIDDLQLEVIDQRDLSVTAFESFPAPPGRRRYVRFNIRGNGTNVLTYLTAFESTHAFSHHPTVPHDIKTMAQARKLRLADPPDNSGDLPIEILIGGDYYWEIVKDAAPIRLSPSVVLLPSKLGWILSGSRSAVTASSIMVNYVELGQNSFNVMLTFVVFGT